MRLVCIAMGSRGDVQPYVALCAGLRQAGHAVRLATHAEFEGLTRAAGVEFFDVGADPRKLLESKLAEEMLGSGTNVLRFLALFGKIVEPILEESIWRALLAGQDADGLIHGNIGVLAHRLAPVPIPSCAVCLQPITPTNAYPSPFFPPLPGGRLGYNRLSHRLFAELFWQCMGKPVLRAQRRVGLPMPDARTRREARQHQCVCYAYSPAVIPPPPDLPPHHHVTGYCFLDPPPGWQPPATLVDFLAAGPPPVFIGFGSMRNANPEATAALAIGALQRSGQRGVLLTGWNGLQQRDVPEDVLLVEDVPHSWLFPRMRAVVHHGGAGTTAAGLRAGVPSIVVPFFADQPFWARTVHQAGVGPCPIPRAHLTQDRLADAITTAVQDTPLQTRATHLGTRIQAEHGVRNAVRVIEECFGLTG